jgi:hypothetical protein
MTGSVATAPVLDDADQSTAPLPEIEDADAPLMTRRGLVEYAHRLGVPVSPSRLHKDGMLGRLKADAYLGRVGLYTPRTASAYIRSLVTLNPRRMVGSRSGRIDETVDA